MTLLKKAIELGIIGSCFMGAVLTQGASAEERTLTIPAGNQNIVATLETPEKANPPIVVMLHGFTGYRDELSVSGTDEGVFSRIARQLAEAGFASLRIDFRGSGESDGKWEDTTFSGQISDAVTAIDWVKSQEEFAGSKVGVIGWSQGGLVASHAAAERPDLDAVVLMAPATIPLSTYGQIFGAPLMEKALAADPEELITGTLPWGVDTTLKARFYQEMPLTSPLAAAANYDGPLLVIMGLKDALITPQPAVGEAWLKYHQGEEKLVTLETGHAWGAFDGPAMIDEQVMPAILGWFEERL
ncbi:alpha/beta fold hydrolase [Pseudovibrio sp. Tun.PSC04-5.I4]|uniref:alpha/beta hydrolase family protein n=1 Tax=Pseudovibrio sp. Tun.PSC04-5.I4 TaxID=1798213 RepID=UPI00088345FF|nr:alpha/beta fold hydrolase [Pseudovibrio sp. Tun.PSC04-5.I4]SDQ16224.1 hypothetical protein SAMN04515695_0254 [Pseudovibrio sp. Tun.PSC04-5.I4]